MGNVTGMQDIFFVTALKVGSLVFELFIIRNKKNKIINRGHKRIY